MNDYHNFESFTYGNNKYQSNLQLQAETIVSILKSCGSEEHPKQSPKKVKEKQNIDEVLDTEKPENANDDIQDVITDLNEKKDDEEIKKQYEENFKLLEEQNKTPNKDKAEQEYKDEEN